MLQNTILFLLLGVALAVSEIEDSLNSDEERSECLSDACRKNAEEIFKSMKPTVNPCDDFYEYSCGNWASNHPIPEDFSIWNPRLEAQSRIMKHLQDALESRGLEPIASILSKIGGWPLAMNEWNENEYNWQKIDNFFSRLTGKNTFFSFEINPDFENYNYILSIDYPKLPLFSKIDYDRKRMYSNRKYKNFIIEVALAISKESGSNVSRRKVTEEIEEMLYFEKQINSVMTKGLRWIKKQTIEELINFKSRQDVKSKNPTSRINILDAINNILEIAKLQVNETETVNVHIMGFLPTLIYILDQSSPRTIVNFVHWSFISNVIDYTTEKFLKMKFDVTKDFHGQKKMVSRSRTCIDNMKMTHILANEFMKKYFKPALKDEATDLTHNIQNQFEEIFLDLTWMDKAAKNECLEKVRGLTKWIGAPDWYNNKTALLAEYNELSIGSKYFENELNYVNFNSRETFRHLGQDVDIANLVGTDDIRSPLMINAFYIMFINTIGIPAANFQPPFFTPSQPSYLNYGFIGFYIAHEMSHAFDDEGRRFNNDGGWSNWSVSTEKMYENKTSCFIRQTTELTKNEKKSKFQEQHGIGLVTKSENLADTTGLKILYGAYKEKTRNERRLKLPGLDNFSDDQLFFLSFANFWCENSTPEADAFRAEDDKHSKPKYRVISSVSNLKEFAEAFQCPVGSPMNPEQKCSILE